jgi:putative Holliday junction resolvase
MDKILGIDYGRAKVGLAVSSGSLASPLKVIKYSDESSLFTKIKEVVDLENISKIVVGVSEGKMASESKKFGNILEGKFNIAVSFIDETLTTSDVQRLSIEAGMSRKKRKNMEDAFAATLILQSFLDSK